MNDASKHQQHILGKLIALIREIYLKEPLDGSGQLHQFRGGDGKTKRTLSNSGIYLNWWFTDLSRRIIEELVEMALEVDPNLRGSSRASLSKVIIDTLKDNAFNHDLFLSNEMFHGSAGTLFEARENCEVLDFAERLWCKINQGLSASLSNWLVIFPLVRIKPISVGFGYDGLSLLSPFDRTKWTQLSTRYKINPDLDPTIGGTEKANLKYFLRNLPFTWLGCEVTSGTMDAGREMAGECVCS